MKTETLNRTIIGIEIQRQFSNFNENVLEENLLQCYFHSEICTVKDIFNSFMVIFVKKTLTWPTAAVVELMVENLCYEGLHGLMEAVTPQV